MPPDRPALFDPEAQDRAAYRRDLKRLPAAGLHYVIHFTPRSGSSWLADILSATGRLSQPGECFNPSFVPAIAQRMNAANLRQYIAMLERWRNTHGVFGCQLTYYHLRVVFGGAERFMRFFGQAPCLWLLREDIVLQAVSLAKKQQTNIGHTAHAGEMDRAEVDRGFVYDAEQIARFVRHVFEAEQGTEAIFSEYGPAPLRLSYERMTAMGAEAAVNVVAHHIGVPPVRGVEIATGHAKLGTDRNAEYAARFRAEHAEMMAAIDAARAGRLAAVDRTLPDSLPPGYRS